MQCGRGPLSRDIRARDQRPVNEQLGRAERHGGEFIAVTVPAVQPRDRPRSSPAYRTPIDAEALTSVDHRATRCYVDIFLPSR